MTLLLVLLSIACTACTVLIGLVAFDLLAHR